MENHSNMIDPLFIFFGCEFDQCLHCRLRIIKVGYYMKHNFYILKVKITWNIISLAIPKNFKILYCVLEKVNKNCMMVVWPCFLVL